MNPRRPHAAVTCAAIPALSALVVAGCHDPVCGTSRGDELEAHGTAVRRGFRAGDPGTVLHEMAVAMGLVAHTSTTLEPMHAAGALRAVTELPSPQSLVDTSGAILPTAPIAVPPSPPPPTVTPRHPHPQPMPVPGGIRPTTVLPPSPPAPPEGHTGMGRRAIVGTTMR